MMDAHEEQEEDALNEVKELQAQAALSNEVVLMLEADSAADSSKLRLAGARFLLPAHPAPYHCEIYSSRIHILNILTRSTRTCAYV